MSQVYIRGVGCYLREARLTNQELVSRLGVTDDYIVKLTGVRERRRAAAEPMAKKSKASACWHSVRERKQW